MSVKKRFYPTTPKYKQSQSINWQNFISNTGATFDLSSPVKFNDSAVSAVYETWAQKFADDWVNNTANIGAGNSIIQFSEWVNQRLPYAECAFLASDSIINNALSKIANEILRKGGEIKLELENKDAENEIIKALEMRIKELKFWDTIHKAITTALTYGGALIFIDTNTDDLTSPIYDRKETASANKIHALKVIEPYLCGAVRVNSANPLNADFMKPSEWFISGGGSVNSSRLERLVMFETPDMIKPLYNYFGVSLCQFMKSYVMAADVSRQALNDIFLRFRTIIIKSDLAKINAEQAKDRLKYINQARNNAGTLLLTADEEYNETITSLSGLDKIIAQMQENIAVSARMPAVKLLGLTPSGFNATGDFDLKSYYDEIMSLQNSIIKPIVERFLRIFALEMGFDIYPEFEFEKLDNESKLNSAQINSTESQTIMNLIQSGIITQEQGFDYLQGKEILDKGLKFDSSAEDLVDFGEVETPSENEPTMPPEIAEDTDGDSV